MDDKQWKYKIGSGRMPMLVSYYFFLEFTDIYGKTRKFQFEKPVHEREVNVLKERIERANPKNVPM